MSITQLTEEQKSNFVFRVGDMIKQKVDGKWYEVIKESRPGNFDIQVIDTKRNKSIINRTWFLATHGNEIMNCPGGTYLITKNINDIMITSHKKKCAEMHIKLQKCTDQEERLMVYKNWFYAGPEGVCDVVRKISAYFDETNTWRNNFKLN